jgi:hypothetical protein
MLLAAFIGVFFGMWGSVAFYRGCRRNDSRSDWRIDTPMTIAEIKARQTKQPASVS